jgi:hypothetical protein
LELVSHRGPPSAPAQLHPPSDEPCQASPSASCSVDHKGRYTKRDTTAVYMLPSYPSVPAQAHYLPVACCVLSHPSVVLSAHCTIQSPPPHPPRAPPSDPALTPSRTPPPPRAPSTAPSDILPWSRLLCQDSCVSRQRCLPGPTHLTIELTTKNQNRPAAAAAAVGQDPHLQGSALVPTLHHFYSCP